MPLRRVATFGTVAAAHLARSALEAAGIEATVTDEETVSLNWLYSNAVGGVKLFVTEEDFDAAVDVLSAYANAPQVTDAEAESAVVEAPPQLVCGECGGTAIVRTPRVIAFLLIAALLFGVGLVAGERELGYAGILVALLITLLLPARRCASCGAPWTEEDDADTGFAPPPNAADLVDIRCPHCGSLEFHRIEYRQLKVMPLLFSPSALIVTLIWPFLAKRECSDCGFRR